jgi:hypothetical protein
MVMFDGDSRLKDDRFLLSEAKGSSGLSGYGSLIVSVWRNVLSPNRKDFSDE